jgi:hypothetical protein
MLQRGSVSAASRERLPCLVGPAMTDARRLTNLNARLSRSSCATQCASGDVFKIGPPTKAAHRCPCRHGRDTF